MVLLNSSIVVKESRLGSWHDVETVGRPGVLKIVNDGGQYRGEDFQVAQPVLSSAHKCILFILVA